MRKLLKTEASKNPRKLPLVVINWNCSDNKYRTQQTCLSKCSDGEYIIKKSCLSANIELSNIPNERIPLIITYSDTDEQISLNPYGYEFKIYRAFF